MYGEGVNETMPVNTVISSEFAKIVKQVDRKSAV
jgi:hypothetical protein